MTLSRTLARGATGDDVRALQVALTARRFGRPTASGVFDAATEAAVRTAQRALGLPADGRYGPATAARLAAPAEAPALTSWGALT